MVGTPSGKSLFELQVERLRRVKELFFYPKAGGKVGGVQARIPLYVMTSPATDAPTKEYWEKNDFFGLPRDEVLFFQQGTLPCLTLTLTLTLIGSFSNKERSHASPMPAR